LRENDRIAVGGSDFLARHANCTVGDLKSLGWTVLVIGVVQVFADFGALAKNQLAPKNQLAQPVGVAAAAPNAVAQLILMRALPY
jgi:hypothetical protein